MKIHCIGIGGIGVSALAQYYLAQGHQVSGSDLAASEITDFLQKKGVKIFIGNKPENIKEGIILVIHSPAVKPENPEYKKAKELGIKLQSYPEALGELTKKYYTIAISGSHGKSTTTAMTGLLLAKAGLDPTIIVGTRLKELGNSNFREGKSKYLVIEACEYDGSFLQYSPSIIVVTNVDKEHLDYFKTFANVKKAFKEFIARLPDGGILIESKKVASKKDAEALKKLLKIPGEHNVSNASCALAVARALGVDDKVSFKSLSEYKGSWRRFEIVKEKPYTVISDYAHHPNEILATLTAAREKYPKHPSTPIRQAQGKRLRARKIWLIFQPHQHQRTHYLFNDFVKVFKKVKIDNIIITDIYDVAGREAEKINKTVDSQMLVKKIGRKNVKYMPIDAAEKFVKENIKSGEVLIVMGAGDVYKLSDEF